MKVYEFDDGFVIEGKSDSKEVIEFVKNKVGSVPLIVADPPYGNIVNKKWDKQWKFQQELVDWMLLWTKDWSDILVSGGAFYVWGGIGKPGFRPFLSYASLIESQCESMKIANMITWSKKRGYGIQHNYLFTREECLYLVKGDIKKPYIFHVPYLSERRGYAGFNKRYPAKSEFKRRTNVWSDVTEILSGKLHETQKSQRLHEIMIETHTNEGDYVIDPFCGVGTTALAARRLKRRFIIIDCNKDYIDVALRLLKKH